jgi:cytochrome c oxidase subunit 3
MANVATMAHGTHAEERLPTGKLAMWIFLASEIMFFAGLFGTYIVLRVTHPDLFHPDKLPAPLNVPLAAMNTAFLITSSLTMALGVRASWQNDNAGIRKYLGITAVLGIAFCVVKYFEYSQKLSHGITPGYSSFYSCYFGMTGIHLIHVVGGIIPIAWMALKASDGRYCRPGNTRVELLGLYWHFVDLVWIYLFPVLYLIK